MIQGIVVGASGPALAAGASAAYLVSPSQDERSSDARPASVSVDTRTHVGAPAARDARAVTAPQAKLGERADGVGRTGAGLANGNDQRLSNGQSKAASTTWRSWW